MTRKGNTINGLDTGKLIKEQMFNKGMSKARLGRKVGRSGNTVRGIINNTSVQTYILWEVSVALGHNFFADLAAQLRAATEGKLEQEAAELEVLKQENLRLREERDYLRKAIDMTGK